MILAWFATVAALISYSLINRLGLKQFDVVNVLSFPPIMLFAIGQKAYPSAVLSACFGLTALLRLYADRY